MPTECALSSQYIDSSNFIRAASTFGRVVHGVPARFAAARTGTGPSCLNFWVVEPAVPPVLSELAGFGTSTGQHSSSGLSVLFVVNPTAVCTELCSATSSVSDNKDPCSLVEHWSVILPRLAVYKSITLF